jgi:hypothetical protein
MVGKGGFGRDLEAVSLTCNAIKRGDNYEGKKMVSGV